MPRQVSATLARLVGRRVRGIGPGVDPTIGGDSLEPLAQQASALWQIVVQQRRDPVLLLVEQLVS